MAEKKIQPKRPTGDEPAAGSRKADKNSMKLTHKKTMKRASFKKSLKKV